MKPGVALSIERSTLIGVVNVQRIEASNCIFNGVVTVERGQEGCVRFCYVPLKSSTPKRYRCQPDLALLSAKTPAEEAAVLDHMVPDFTDESLPGPAYLQLTRTTPLEIRAGADNGSAMGVWSHLLEPQREANLLSALDEYLGAGLQAGLIFIN